MATITHAIRIRAPRAQVYQALTTPYGLKGWNTPDLEGDVAQGQEFTLRFNDGQSFRWKASKLINESTVSWECISGPGAAAGSTVTYELSDTSDGRTGHDRVLVGTHRRLFERRCAHSFSRRWSTPASPRRWSTPARGPPAAEMKISRSTAALGLTS
jgi:uncharacterized protein YndB with AHSA1/START domain